jgi:hypothetical protein
MTLLIRVFYNGTHSDFSGVTELQIPDSGILSIYSNERLVAAFKSWDRFVVLEAFG